MNKRYNDNLTKLDKYKQKVKKKIKERSEIKRANWQERKGGRRRRREKKKIRREIERS